METSESRRRFLGMCLAAGAGLALSGVSGMRQVLAADAAASPLDGVVLDPATLVGRDGFFRVGKSTSGRWWMVTPEGKPFLYRGACALWMPDDGSGSEAAAYRKRWEAQHGRDTDGLVANCLGILRSLGFNALGEWATPQFWNRGWPYTVLIHVRQVRPASNITNKLPDIFDPAWQRAYEARCQATCAPLADQRDLVGYFIDNEGSFYQARKDYVWGYDTGPMVDKTVLGTEPLLLQMFLAADPTHPGHQVAWDFVTARHGGTVARVAADWGANFDSPGTLRALHEKGLALASKAFAADQDAFTTYFVQEYFRHTAEAIRAHDPHHLLLGCRYGGPPGEVVLKAYDRRHVDVLSFNNYRPNFRQRAEEYVAAGLPLLNTEFSWASGGFADWNKLQAGKTFTAEEKAVCRARGIAALEGVFTHPAVIGYTWYKFCTRFPDPDGPQYGLVDPDGNPNRFNQEMLASINARLESIACGQLEATKAP